MCDAHRIYRCRVIVLLCCCALGCHSAETELVSAIKSKNKKDFQYLLENGANPNVLNSRCLGAMHYAAGESDPFWLELALQHGGDPNLISRGNSLGDVTPIFCAIDNECVQSAEILIRHGADLNHQNSLNGNFPLYDAASSQNYDIVLLLLNAGADCRLRNKFGHSIYDATRRDVSFVHEAQRDNYLEVKRVLTEKAASADGVSNHQQYDPYQ
jgi:ankyrin repeat protein